MSWAEWWQGAKAEERAAGALWRREEAEKLIDERREAAEAEAPHDPA
jgi:hypothetical protein